MIFVQVAKSAVKKSGAASFLHGCSCFQSGRANPIDCECEGKRVNIVFMVLFDMIFNIVDK